MKTTCLIPVPVKKIKYLDFKFLGEENGAIGSDPDGTLHLVKSRADVNEFNIKELFSLQSGYFFTEEEMNILLKSLIEAKDGLINQSLLSIEKGQDTAGADGMATGLMLAIKRINELLTTK